MNIIREIYTEKQGIAADELFVSSEFRSSMSHAIETALESVDRKVNLKFENNSTDFTASTNGGYIRVNLNSPLIRIKKTIYDRYVAVVGHIVHECGHILFTDFEETNKAINSFNSGNFNWYPETPKHKNQAVIADILNRNNALTRAYLSKLYFDLFNIIEDQYIESQCRILFSGLYSESLDVNDKDKFESTVTKERLLWDVANGKKDLASAGYYMFWVLTLAPEMKSDGTPLDDRCREIEEKMNRFLSDGQPYIQILRTSSTGRVAAMNELFCCFWDLILDDLKQEMDDPKSGNQNSGKGSQGNSQDASQGNSGGDSQQDSQQDSKDSFQADSFESSGGTEEDDSNGDGCEEDGSSEEGCDEGGSDGEDQGSDSSEQEEKTIDQMEKSVKKKMNHLKKTDDSIESTKTPVGNTKPINMPESHVVDTASGALDAAMNELAWDKIDQRELKAMNKDLRSVCKNEMPLIVRMNKSSSEYESNRKYMAPVIMKTTNLLKRVLRERKISASKHGYLSGRFSSREYVHAAVHENSYYFLRKRNPGNIPDVAFVVRVDLSGSMDGSKILAARRAAVALAEVFEALHIPYMVYGDSVPLGTTISLASKFDDDSSQLARIGSFNSTSCRGGTPDPISLNFGCRELLKRPEKRKVYISITDGYPNVSSEVYSEDAEIDTQMTVQYYSQKGIDIFAAVIDGSIEKIHKMYGNKTIDLTDLYQLPRQLASLCSRYILK